MAVSVSCPECAASFPVSEELLGKKMRCKGCQAVFVAAAAKVKVGAGVGPQRSAPPSVGSNGVHKPAPRSAVQRKPGGNGLLLAGIGGAVVFAAMAAVTVWAVFLKDAGKTDAPVAGTSSIGAVPKIDINDTPSEDAAPSKKANVEKSKAVSAPAAPPKRTGPAWFVDSPASLPFALRPDILERLKKSAAFIQVDNASGSGWFAEPGIIITNSHVVGMKEPVAPPPKKMKVVLDSGLPTERSFVPELLGIDRYNDLAILRITGDNLPPPMPIARSSSIREGCKMYTVGFPAGSRYEREFAGEKEKLEMRVKVRESSIAGRLATTMKSIKLLQIEGGVDGGNSGGMMTDAGGNVRGVVVMERRGTNMRFAIPSEYVIFLLQGRILDIVPGQPYQTGDAIRQPLTAHIVDPMKRIQSVSLEIWTGERGRGVRPSATSAPKPIPGDTARQTVRLPYNRDEPVALGESHTVTAECELPLLADGQVYWVQPRYTSTAGVDRWGEAVALETAGLPVERKSATLALRHQVGTKRKVNVESHFGIALSPEHEFQLIRDNGLRVKLTETVQSVQPDGSAKISLKYDDIGYTDHELDEIYRSMARGLLEAGKGMSAIVQVTKNGMIRKPELKMDKVPVPVKQFLSDFNTQIIQSLEALNLGLPDKELQPGSTWQRDTNYAINVGSVAENALFKLTYRYVGSRVRDGREEAVIEFDGGIAKGETAMALMPSQPGKGKANEKETVAQTRGLFGTARGAAIVDIATGAVTLASTKADMQFDVDYPSLGVITFGGEYVVELTRQITPTSAPVVARKLLPNQEVLLYPFVGAPDTSLGD